MAKEHDSDNVAAPTAGSRATLKTIAQLTGLSLSTVSLSLRGGATLKDETNKRVADAAQKLGYVPDRAGVRLRTGKTNVIALVLDGAEESIDFARHMIQGIGHALHGSRYHLTVIPEFKGNTSVETIRYILENRTADGVVITHTMLHDARVQMLLDAGFSFVTHGRTASVRHHAFHDFHAEAFVAMAVQRLVALGRSDIALVIGDDTTTNHHNIVTAFAQSTQRLGAKARVLDNVTGKAAAEIRALGLAMATAGNRPTGVICNSEMRTIALVGGLQEGGVTLGRDLDLVYKQTSDILPTLFPKLDSISEDVFAAGVELTRLLLAEIGGEPPAALHSLSEPVANWRSR